MRIFQPACTTRAATTDLPAPSLAAAFQMNAVALTPASLTQFSTTTRPCRYPYI